MYLPKVYLSVPQKFAILSLQIKIKLISNKLSQQNDSILLCSNNLVGACLKTARRPGFDTEKMMTSIVPHMSILALLVSEYCVVPSPDKNGSACMK